MRAHRGLYPFINIHQRTKTICFCKSILCRSPFINIHQRTKTICVCKSILCRYPFINIHQRTKTHVNSTVLPAKLSRLLIVAQRRMEFK